MRGKQLGVRAKEFIADPIRGRDTLRALAASNGAGKITAKLIRANNFEIEDSATGELYCVRITNGDWDKKKGECNSITPQSTPTPTPEESTEVEPQSEDVKSSVFNILEPESTPSPESTPEPIPTITSTPETTPEITPEPAPEATPEAKPVVE